MGKTMITVDPAMGARLAALRQSRKGLTKRKLAAEWDITPQAISNYEGGRIPDRKRLESYAEYFGTTVDYLLGRSSYADPIEAAGAMLGLSSESAHKLLAITDGTAGSVVDELIGSFYLQDMLQTFETFFKNARPSSMSFFISNGVLTKENLTPDLLRAWLAHRGLGSEDTAWLQSQELVSIGTAAATLAQIMLFERELLEALTHGQQDHGTK